MRGVPRWLSPPCPPCPADPPPPNSGMLQMEPEPAEAAGIPQVSAPEVVGRRLLLVTMAAEVMGVLAEAAAEEERLLPDCCGFTPNCCRIMDTSLSVAALAWMVVLPKRHWWSAFWACKRKKCQREKPMDAFVPRPTLTASSPDLYLTRAMLWLR